MRFLLIHIDLSASGWEDFFAIFACVALPGLAAFIWVAFFRKRRRRKRRHRSGHTEYTANPTLAQTRGLPPLRKPENVSDQPKS